MKHLAAYTLALVLLAASLTGCSDGRSPSADNGTSVKEETKVSVKEAAAKPSKDEKTTTESAAEKKPASPSPEEQAKKESAQDVKTETVNYEGQADSNFIEVYTANKSPKVFMLGDGVKENFDSYNLKKGDDIKLKYRMNEHNQPVILEIEKLNK